MSCRPRIAVAVLGILLIAAAPATKPTTGEEAALRAALKTLAKSLQDGDADGIRTVIHAANPTERKMVDAMAAMAVEIARLHKAAAKAFGAEAATELTGDLAAELSRIDDAEVTFDAPDTATVRYKAEAPPPTTTPAAPAKPEPPPGEPPAPSEPPPPLMLKKIAGKWRVPVAELSKDTTPEEIDQRLADLDVQTKVVAEVSGEIAKGKHKSAEKAAEAWQAKMMQALAPRKAEAQKAPDGAKPNETAKPK